MHPSQGHKVQPRDSRHVTSQHQPPASGRAIQQVCEESKMHNISATHQPESEFDIACVREVPVINKYQSGPHSIHKDLSAIL